MGDYDYLRICEACGDAYTLDRLCRSCAEQEMIDNAEADNPEWEGDLDELDDLEP